MEAWGLTDTGNVREENQDFYRMERLGPETLLAVVCDGMGGARAGNVASRLACEVFCGEVCRSPARRDDRGGGAGRAVHGGEAGQYLRL